MDIKQIKESVLANGKFTFGDNSHTSQALQKVAYEMGLKLQVFDTRLQYKALPVLQERLGLIPFFQEGVEEERGGSGVDLIRFTTSDQATIVSAWLDQSDSDEQYHYVSFVMATLSEEVMDTFLWVAGAFPFVSRPIPRPMGTIHVCIEKQGKLAFHEINTIGEALIRENYSASVISQYDNLAKQLLSPNPVGRLALMAGPPGTGKTRAIRGLINDAKKAFWVLIPSNMVNRLSTPEFLVLLLSYSHLNKPMVLVIEDADEALRKRGEGTDTELSALLNFSDGIFGSMLNTRVVCTTNIGLKEIDDAILRPGRLIETIEIGGLSIEEANRVFTRLTGVVPRGLFSSGVTIAQVYAAAAKHESAKAA